MRFLYLLPLAALASCSSDNSAGFFSKAGSEVVTRISDTREIVSDSVTNTKENISDTFRGGQKVAIVEVNPQLLKEIKSGKDRALAYQEKPRYTASNRSKRSSYSSGAVYAPESFETFTLPAGFELPELPEITEESSRAADEALLLPPRS